MTEPSEGFYRVPGDSDPKVTRILIYRPDIIIAELEKRILQLEEENRALQQLVSLHEPWRRW